ncbi:hypothetical protein SGCOL_000327 [Colletotrichum sp. CLE4]
MLRVVEDTVEMIRETQHPDGFLNSFYTVRGVESRWTNLRYLHELYCLSHLSQAKYFILERVTHNDNDETCFHHETLARGADPYGGLGSDVKGWFHGPPDYAYNQAHRPIREQTEIRGHAIRAMYYYTAVVDLVRRQVTSDPDVVECKQVLKRL